MVNMKLQNSQFGEIEFDENLIITFEEGIIGFEQLKKYLLINLGDDLFLWLTSVEEPEIIFPLFGIRVLMDDFKQIENNEAFGIVKLNQDPAKITINLKAPVYIDQNEKKGFQKILDEDDLPIDYILFKEN